MGMTAPTNGVPVFFGFGAHYKAGGTHKGVDFSDGKEGHRVFSCLPGIVTHVGYGGWGRAYGQHVIIRSVWKGKNVWMIYAHLKTENVSYDQTINAGQVIGTSGGKKGAKYSGSSTGPHVHVQANTANRYDVGYFDPSAIFAWKPTEVRNAPLDSKLNPSIYGEGAVGPAITWLGERLTLWLNAYHTHPPYSEGPGPTWGPADKAAVKLFQEKILKTSGVGADGYPGKLTLAKLNSVPPTSASIPTVPTTPTAGLSVESISANLAAYDVHKGMKNRKERSNSLIHTGLTRQHKPLWWHFQECSADMLSNMDKRMPDYKRISQGGKGRESYYRKAAGVTILEAKLVNVKHMLRGDTKEMLVIAWVKDGYRGVDVNFHSENEGNSVQLPQLWDAISQAVAMAKKHKVPSSNILVTGDSNTKGAAAFVRLKGWREAIQVAKKQVKLAYHSTNGWVKRLVKGRRIDVDVVHPKAEVLLSEQLTAVVVSDHWAHRLIRRLKK